MIPKGSEGTLKKGYRISMLLRAFGLSCALVLAGATMSQAGPWADAGDRQLRSDIELLAQHGLIRGPITTWPLPWKQINARLTLDNGRPLPPHVASALARVRDKMPNEGDFGRVKLALEARGATRTKTARDFGDAARDNADLTASAEVNWSATSLRINIGYQGDDFGDRLVFDGSQLAFALGNWAVYGGWVERWWGPGWSSSLNLSTNARPVPTVGFMRLDPRPFGTKWLSWLGRWQFNAFIGRLDDDERFIKDPYFLGFRLTFEPLEGLEIGLSRNIMVCGDGRPCSFRTWTKALVGVGQVENPTGPDANERDPGNQLAGFDVRYGFRLNDSMSAAIYGQMIGEDEKDFLPFKFAHLAGVSVEGPWGDEGAMWRLTGEYTRTAADGIFRKTEYNVFYNHSRYRSGYRYHNRSLGDRLDGDSQGWYLSGMFTSRNSWTYRLTYQNALINMDDGGRHGLSRNRERINIFEAGLDLPSPIGDLGLELRYEDDKPNTPNRKDSTTAIEARWSASF